MKQNLNRNLSMTFRVDADERDFIYRKMKKAGITNLRHYLLKMAVCGQIVTVDMTDVQECGKMLRSISSNVNQIAKWANSSGYVSIAALNTVTEWLEKVWQQQDKIIRKHTQLIEEDLV